MREPSGFNSFKKVVLPYLCKFPIFVGDSGTGNLMKTVSSAVGQTPGPSEALFSPGSRSSPEMSLADIHVGTDLKDHRVERSPKWERRKGKRLDWQ
jgi:hypothetical protein